MIGATPLWPRGSLAAGPFKPELPPKPPPAGTQGGTGNSGSPSRHRKTGSGGRRRTRKGRETLLPVSMYYLGCQDCQRPLNPHRRRRKGGGGRRADPCRAPAKPAVRHLLRRSVLASRKQHTDFPLIYEQKALLPALLQKTRSSQSPTITVKHSKNTAKDSEEKPWNRRITSL